MPISKIGTLSLNRNVILTKILNKHHNDEEKSSLKDIKISNFCDNATFSDFQLCESKGFNEIASSIETNNEVKPHESYIKNETFTEYSKNKIYCQQVFELRYLN